jgi:hypothetical protein
LAQWPAFFCNVPGGMRHRQRPNGSPFWCCYSRIKGHDVTTVNLLKVDCEGGDFEWFRSLATAE